ncbi:unnamed protein product, partial [Closterium sp. NIES-53]
MSLIPSCLSSHHVSHPIMSLIPSCCMVWVQEDLVEGGHGLMVNGYLPVLDALAAGLDIRFNH